MGAESALMYIRSILLLSLQYSDIPGGVVVSKAAFHPAGPGSIPGEVELFFSCFFHNQLIIFSKYNQFDLIKWTVSIPIFNISIKLYDPLNILCWLGQEKSKKISAAYVAERERPLFLD